MPGAQIHDTTLGWLKIDKDGKVYKYIQAKVALKNGDFVMYDLVGQLASKITPGTHVAAQTANNLYAPAGFAVENIAASANGFIQIHGLFSSANLGTTKTIYLPFCGSADDSDSLKAVSLGATIVTSSTKIAGVICSPTGKIVMIKCM